MVQKLIPLTRDLNLAAKAVSVIIDEWRTTWDRVFFKKHI